MASESSQFTVVLSNDSSLKHAELGRAPATGKVAALPLLGKKSSGAAAYRYPNEKVAPLPLLACKTAAAAATLKK